MLKKAQSEKIMLSKTVVFTSLSFVVLRGGAYACEISSDVALYHERAEQAIILTQYENIVLRATDGKIRCVEEKQNARQECLIDGPGEILVEADRGLFVVRVSGNDRHELHVYASGDLSCGLTEELQ